MSPHVTALPSWPHWPRWLAPIVSGLLIVAAVPPFNVWPLALVALLPLFLAIRSATWGRGLLWAWMCGFVVNLCGQSWGVALLGRLAHVAPLPAAAWVLLICAYQAAVFPLWIGAAELCRRRLSLSWVVTAPLCIVGAEAALPFLFPWYLGIGVWRAWPLVQVAELGGPSAVSALVVLLNVIGLELWTARLQHRPLWTAARRGAGWR